MYVEIFQFSYGSDNYGVLIHDASAEWTICIDAGDAETYLAALAQTDWALDEIWVTHHHGDHVAGLSELKSKTSARAIGPDIAGVDRVITEGDVLDFAGREVKIIATPGHTLDMLNFYIPADKLLFTGDTLFVMGCGRLFEGTPAQMWDSLQKLDRLPDDTVIYCSHEYTLANGAFALSVDPQNAALKARSDEVRAMRAKGEPTVPTTLAQEKQTNPFLRPHDPAIRATLRMESASDADVFAELRRRKDSF